VSSGRLLAGNKMEPRQVFSERKVSPPPGSSHVSCISIPQPPEIWPMKTFAPVILLIAVACNSSDGTAPKGSQSDISTMTVGEVRVLNPSDIPNGIDLPSGSGARDYVIIVGNTNPTIDAVANFVVKADRSAGGSSDLSANSDLNSGLNRASQTINAATPPQQAFETRVRAFERQNLSLRSKSG